MKRILLISFGVVVVLAFAMMYTVWKASQEPVTHTPSAVDRFRMSPRSKPLKRLRRQLFIHFTGLKLRC